MDYIGIAIALRALPAEERERGNRLHNLLMELSSIVDELNSSVALFDHVRTVSVQLRESGKADRNNPDLARSYNIARKWPSIAARDASMAVWHFGEAMRYTKVLLKKSPTLDSLTNWPAIKGATKAYSEYFARGERIEHLRNAISHKTEINEFPEVHATKGNADIPGIKMTGNASLIVVGSLHNSTFIYTWKGKARKLDITMDTVGKLAQVRDLLYSGLVEMAAELKSRALKQRPAGIWGLS
jgi:hypothetical protein